jgi:hypothetical protein
MNRSKNNAATVHLAVDSGWCVDGGVNEGERGSLVMKYSVQQKAIHFIFACNYFNFHRHWMHTEGVFPKKFTE